MNAVRAISQFATFTAITGLVAACAGPTGPTGARGPAGDPCTVTRNADGSATVKCPDGSSTVLTGTAGTNGTNGTNGTDGVSCTVSANPDAGTRTISCTDGTSIVLKDGANGTNGTNGTSGLSPDGGIPTRLTNFHGTAALDKIAFDSTGKYLANASITSASADVAGTVAIAFTIKDRADAGVTGLKGFSFNIARLTAPATGEASNRWVPYLQRLQVVSDAGTYPRPAGTAADQGSTENTGTLVELGSGKYTYTFLNKLGTTRVPTSGSVIPYDRAVPHRVSVMFGGSVGPTGTATFDFVPDGSAATLSRAIVQTSSCKACHGEEFHGHGGNRRTVENCVTCHSPGMIDPQGGETLDLKVMIHKIHAGGHLDSVPGPDGKVWDDPATAVDESADNGSYAIWGFGDRKQEWSKVGFPAEIANCTKCHQGTGAQVDNWKTVPSREACGSCHDQVNFVTGTNHAGGVQANDNACAVCHPASGAIVPGVIYPIPTVHDFMTNDPRNVQEFDATLTVTGQASGNGHFVAGDIPVVHLVLKENGVPIDHTTLIADDSTTVVPAGDGPEGCALPGPCPPRDGKFTVSNLFVSGPRALRNPVLTTKARVLIKSPSSVVFPVNLSSRVTTSGLTTETSSLGIKLDGNEDLWVVDAAGRDSVIAAAVTVPLVTIGFSGRVTSAASLTSLTDAQQTTWVNHQWVGFTFQVTSGTAKNQEAMVLDNIGGVLTLASGLTVVPDGTSLYRLTAVTGSRGGLVSAVPSTTSVSDTTQAWVDKQWAGWTLKIVSGTGAGQAMLVTTNIGNVLTLASAFATPPDTTSRYLLTPFATSPAAAIAPEIITWLNSYPAFKARAIAYPEGNSVAIRSRNLGRFFALQLTASFVATQVFAGDLTQKVIGGSTAGNALAKQTDPARNDPKVAWSAGEVTYTLDPVDNLKPGTYIAKLELGDRGAKSPADYKTPTVARVTFQVGTAIEERPPANNCGQCHTDPTDTKGLVVDYMRHQKLLNNTAVDLCGSCHDYQPQSPTLEWTGAQPISRRVHGIHFGSSLNFPLLTVGYANGDPVPGRNWDITFPQDVRNCDTTCHNATTSGTWKTRPARLPCSGCHDSLPARAHMKAMTFDPTPNDPWSGDEGEACKACH